MFNFFILGLIVIINRNLISITEELESTGGSGTCHVGSVGNVDWLSTKLSIDGSLHTGWGNA